MTQPDLLGDFDTTVRDALHVLAHYHPRTLELLIGDRRPDGGEVKAGLNHPWAYSVRREGLYIEHETTWGGWYAKPRHFMPWPELDRLTASDPRLDDVRAWSESLTAIDAWKDRYRPHELDANLWHPQYITTDHARPGWPERLHTWEIVIAICNDAATLQDH